MKQFGEYYNAVKFLDSIFNIPSKNYELDKKNSKYDRSFFTKRLKYLLKLLGNPHKGFKYIHVAGTAGKGSTVTMIHEILQKSGKKVGSFYSPHPTTPIERIKVGNLYISPNDFAKLINQIKPALDKCQTKSPYGTPSYFEIFLSIAFLYYKQKKCEYVVLEAGLGGQEDATNVIEKPLIAIITNVNLDHQEILGKTLTEIANDKAGIIKKSSTFITGEARPAIIEILKQRCKKIGAKYCQLYKNEKHDNNFVIRTVGKILKIENKIINEVIKNTKLPCRFELIQKNPKIILDGSHNPAKIAKLINNLNNIKYKKLILIFAISYTKDYKKILKVLLPKVDEIILTRFSKPLRKTADLKNMDGFLKKNSKKSTVFLDPKNALAYARKIQKKDDLILITGSFFLAGELRTNWIPEEQILRSRTSF